MKHLKGKIALVTGASRSTGIGTAICLAFAEAGADVYFTYYSPYDKSEGCGEEKGWPEVLADQLKQFGVNVGHMEADLSDKELPQKLLNVMWKQSWVCLLFSFTMLPMEYQQTSGV